MTKRSRNTPSDPGARAASGGAAALAAGAPSRRWLFGPALDLALGCGAAYGAVFVLLAVAGQQMRDAVPLWALLVPFNLISGAHYGATVVRAYERAEDRSAYALFTLWTTALLGAAFVAGLASYSFGSWVITTYLTWSPWHYAGQNFGISMLFLRRRGVQPTDLARRLLHTSFVSSSVLAGIALHFTGTDVAYAPAQIENTVYGFRALGGILGAPAALGDGLMIAAGAVYVVSTGGAVFLLRRAATFRDLVPTLVLVATQALWFSVPVLARHTGFLSSLDPLSPEPATASFAFVWIGFGHVFQYLWITTYFSKEAGRSKSHAGFILRSMLAGTALWVVPALLFAPGILGRLPYDAGLAVMIGALVNLHHFVLDGVIWKLRDARIAGILVRRENVRREAAESGAAAEPAPAPMRPALRAALWAGGFLVVGVGTWSTLETGLGFNRAYLDRDFAAARRASERLELVGQASAEQRLKLGNLALEAGDLAAAETEFKRSIEIMETAWAWTGLGEAYHRSEDRESAAEAYRRALRLEPDHAVATFYAGIVALETGQIDRGTRALERALELARTAKEPDEALIAAISGELGKLK